MTFISPQREDFSSLTLPFKLYWEPNLHNCTAPKLSVIYHNHLFTVSSQMSSKKNTIISRKVHWSWQKKLPVISLRESFRSLEMISILQKLHKKLVRAAHRSFQQVIFVVWHNDSAPIQPHRNQSDWRGGRPKFLQTPRLLTPHFRSLSPTRLRSLRTCTHFKRMKSKKNAVSHFSSSPSVKSDVGPNLRPLMSTAHHHISCGHFVGGRERERQRPLPFASPRQHFSPGKEGCSL